MQAFDPTTPRVLLAAPVDARLGGLAEGLDSRGWRTLTVRSAPSAIVAIARQPFDAVLVDLADLDPDLLALPPRLRAIDPARRLPILAIGKPEAALEALGFDLALSPPLHPQQTAMRLESLLRAAVAEEEVALRAETFAAHGRTLPAPSPDARPVRVLTVGEPAPKFLALRHALSEQGAEVVAAFSAYTAFDYLHESRFDAVVLWAGETHAEALSIAGGMRRNTRLYHIPTLLYLREGADVALAEAFGRGLSDVAAAGTPEAETAARVVALARTHRRETAIRETLERARASGLLDAATGLFTRDLFAAHLSRLAQAAGRRRRLAVAVMRLSSPNLGRFRGSGALDRATPQIGAMLGRLVRAEDTAARLGPDVFALALPAADEAAARSAAQRIAAVIACTAFESEEGEAPFTVDFDVGAAEVRRDETPAAALERAAARSLAKAV